MQALYFGTLLHMAIYRFHHSLVSRLWVVEGERWEWEAEDEGIDEGEVG